MFFAPGIIRSGKSGCALKAAGSGPETSRNRPSGSQETTMKAGMHSIQEFAAEIARRAESKKDFVANTKNVEMTTGIITEPKLEVGDMKLDINKIGHAQLAEVTKIPKPYYDKMLAEEPALLADNVNTWFKRNATPQLFRTLDNKVRAVRSDKF